ncbi:Hypothetical protein A7982_08636 [Minicystis rosea]|nr:Hypothetical protein A7982_08636 [Minicystis rosea]
MRGAIPLVVLRRRHGPLVQGGAHAFEAEAFAAVFGVLGRIHFGPRLSSDIA